MEQQPPKISDSMAPTASHCGMVSMNMRPAKAMARLKTGRLSSMPYISAFSREGAALITRGDGAGMAYALSPRSLLLGGVCLCSAGRRRDVMARGVVARGPSLLSCYRHIKKRARNGVTAGCGTGKGAVPSRLATGTEQGETRFSGQSKSKKDGQVVGAVGAASRSSGNGGARREISPVLDARFV